MSSSAVFLGPSPHHQSSAVWDMRQMSSSTETDTELTELVEGFPDEAGAGSGGPGGARASKRGGAVGAGVPDEAGAGVPDQAGAGADDPGTSKQGGVPNETGAGVPDQAGAGAGDPCASKRGEVVGAGVPNERGAGVPSEMKAGVGAGDPGSSKRGAGAGDPGASKRGAGAGDPGASKQEQAVGVGIPNEVVAGAWVGAPEPARVDPGVSKGGRVAGAGFLDEVEWGAGTGAPEPARVDPDASKRGRAVGAVVPDEVEARAGGRHSRGSGESTDSRGGRVLVFQTGYQRGQVFQRQQGEHERQVRAGAGVPELVEAASMVGVVIVAPGAPVQGTSGGARCFGRELVGAATVDPGPPDRERAAGAEVVALEMGQFRWGAHGGGVRGEHSSDHPGAGADGWSGGDGWSREDGWSGGDSRLIHSGGGLLLNNSPVYQIWWGWIRWGSGAMDESRMNRQIQTTFEGQHNSRRCIAPRDRAGVEAREASPSLACSGSGSGTVSPVLVVLVVFSTEKPPFFKRVRAPKMLGEGLGAGIIQISLGFRSTTQKFESTLQKKQEKHKTYRRTGL
ncbi:hypothetical protein B0H14DRAFT_2625972 [Mycena olivaceomarginata]|nr:hypothetical protein B0H14DRAFT_2625972 [Mycena olivaceomarginata]